jgi:Mg2+-importing ATPase
MMLEREKLWSLDEHALLSGLDTSSAGISAVAAEGRLSTCGPNILHREVRNPRLKLAAAQFKSPIAILLACAAILSTLVGDGTDGVVIVLILLISTLLGYWQELRAHVAIQALLKRLAATSEVLRDGSWQVLPSAHLVPGDIVRLGAGSMIPADCRVLESKDLSVDQASLTGESFPCDKHPGICAAATPLEKRDNVVFVGTHVLSGSGIVVVARTGSATIYGELAASVQSAQSSTEFEVGVRRFGYFLLEVAVALSLVVLAVNLTYERPVLDALLFTLALVVGMTPQLLPAIVTTTLAQGAHRMAQRQTIVRRLTSIADLGGVTILCTDKTGTLTEGVVRWEGSVSCDGTQSELVALYAHLNAVHETGFANPIDDALSEISIAGAERYTKVDEVPYDFSRRMLSVLLRRDAERIMITKGAFHEVLDACSQVLLSSGGVVAIEDVRESCEELFHEKSRQGQRCLAVAYKIVGADELLSRDSEQGMVLAGLVTFSDPPKASAIASVQALEEHGITCKMVTGDNRFVASKLAADLGVFRTESLMTGEELNELRSDALYAAIRDVDIFAEVDPNQKERIIRTLKNAGVGVGYLGDGINDAAALHAADVGISVDTAASITKEAADIVLLDKDLGVLLEAVQEGRKAFANTLKYILVTTSANFGNMFSVAGASLFADFLPMLPKQILLLNILSDLPAMAIATDRVDAEMVKGPLRWNTRSLRDFMLVYGLISSVFDYLTFGTLLLLGVPTPIFRTAWFIESVLSEVFMLLVLRTKRIVWRSHIGEVLVAVSVVVILLTLVLPYSFLAEPLGFAGPSVALLTLVAVILIGYVAASEVAKWRFFSVGRRE